MADSSLDDFFAKKDKSRRGKKNKLTPEELAKQLEVQGSRYDRKKDRSRDDEYGHRGSDLISNLKILEQDDEEWNDFIDDREKDYRGLKIQSLNIRDKEEEMKEQQRALQENGNDKPKDDSGPWNKRAASPAQPVEEVKTPEEIKKDVKEEIKKEESSKTDSSSGMVRSKYVPPALRGGGGDSSNKPRSLSPVSMASTIRKPKGGIPKINDEQDFPSLGD